MKHTLAILLCVVLALAGCSKAPAATTPADTQSVAPATPSPEVTATSDTTETPDDADPAPDAELGTKPPPGADPAAGYVFDGSKSVTSGLDKRAPYKPVAVMIENTVPARPQKGLSKADIVYEVLVESASMTRFMCVFNDYLPNEVGPVRSARPYYVDLAEEYGGAYCFFGGPEGNQPASIYARLDKANLKVAVNGIQGKWGKYYWRSKDRKAPHNVYSDLTRIAELFDELPATHHFLFDAAAAPTGDDATKINVLYNKTTLNTQYAYDAATKKYLRSIDGKPFLDGLDNTQIAVSNVIIQNTKLTFTKDYKGRVDVEFIGKGDADVFTLGKHIKATWEKKSPTDPTIYRDQKGQEIVLQPGNTWVEVVYDKIDYNYGK